MGFLVYFALPRVDELGHFDVVGWNLGSALSAEADIYVYLEES